MGILAGIALSSALSPKPQKTVVVNQNPSYKGYDQVSITTKLKKNKPTQEQLKKKAAAAKRKKSKQSKHLKLLF